MDLRNPERKTLWNISERLAKLCMHHKLSSVLTSTLDVDEWLDSLSAHQLGKKAFPVPIEEEAVWAPGLPEIEIRFFYSKYNYNYIDAVS